MLGRIIERVAQARTGPETTHQAWVKANVLSPSGALGMAIGGNSEASPAPNEVTYYPNGPAGAYGLVVDRMDAHGGWIGTPTDLLRFASHIDALQTIPDILSP